MMENQSMNRITKLNATLNYECRPENDEDYAFECARQYCILDNVCTKMDKIKNIGKDFSHKCFNSTTDSNAIECFE